MQIETGYPNLLEVLDTLVLVSTESDNQWSSSVTNHHPIVSKLSMSVSSHRQTGSEWIVTWKTLAPFENSVSLYQNWK